MNSRQLVAETIRGNNPGRTPVYGWVASNLEKQLTAAFGSVAAFEDRYQFDMAHIFGGPPAFDHARIKGMRERGEEITPQALLDLGMCPTDRSQDYDNVRAALEHHQRQRGRFCYIQSDGIFECVNGPFGIEDHLCYMALYPKEMAEVYRRLALRNRAVAGNMIDLGVDMVHVSDDWGAQRGMLFSLPMWKEYIYPNHKVTADYVKSRGVFLSLHSDGNVAVALPGIVELGYDVMHPWQESAGMGYDLYLNGYQNRLAILGGLCIQTTIGFGNLSRVESELRRVFSLLKGKRWMFCTTHFVQPHCSVDELCFAYDLAVKLARG